MTLGGCTRAGRRNLRAAPVLLMAGLLAASPGRACGFDGLMSDGFGAAHPRSVGVALAIADAIGAGLLDRLAAAPVVPGSAGYWRAVGRLTAVAHLMSGRELPAPVAVLLIDSNLWARIVSEAGGIRPEPHAAGAAEGDVVIVTSEPVVVRLLEGAMPWATALDRGLLAIAGAEKDVSLVRAALHSGFVDHATPSRMLPAAFPRKPGPPVSEPTGR